MEKPKTPDYYKVLGVELQSTTQDIRKAFFQLAKIHHPDKQAPGTCEDAKKFRKVGNLLIDLISVGRKRKLTSSYSQIREAQELLCDEVKRQNYDRGYPALHSQWIRYRRMKEEMMRQEETEEFTATQAEDKRRQRKMAKAAAKERAEAELARKLAEEARLARLEAERKRAEAERRRAEAIRVYELAEEERQAALKAEQERLRAHKEREAEARFQEAGRRAREEQERQAKEESRREKEQQAEERSKQVAARAREQQEAAATERLAQLLIEERQGTVRKNWTKMREQAEPPHLDPADSEKSTPDDAPIPSSGPCIHPGLGWRRKNGQAICHFCTKRVAKYSFHCPDCDVAACASCKEQQCQWTYTTAET